MNVEFHQDKIWKSVTFKHAFGNRGYPTPYLERKGLSDD